VLSSFARQGSLSPSSQVPIDGPFPFIIGNSLSREDDPQCLSPFEGNRSRYLVVERSISRIAKTREVPPPKRNTPFPQLLLSPPCIIPGQVPLSSSSPKPCAFFPSTVAGSPSAAKTAFPSPRNASRRPFPSLFPELYATSLLF